jgi:photosystem II stability/assembly factor-like uncharacterized protein
MDGLDELRTTRRRMRFGAAVAVLAVGLTIPLLRTQLEPVPDYGIDVRPDIGEFESPVVYDVDFVDARHGFALWGRCTNGRNYRCERKLLVTEDGVTWTHRPFSDDGLAAPTSLIGRVTALGPDKILLTDLGDGGARSRFYSDDGGRRWTEVPTAPDGTVSELPSDAILEIACVETVHDLNECRRQRLLVTMPDSGRRARIASPLSQPRPESRALSDGSWWITGRDRTSGQWAVAVSRDDGRTWAVTPLPIESDVAPDRLWLAGSGTNVYLLVSGRIPDTTEPRSLVGILRTTDGGKTWSQPWRANGDFPRTVGGALLTPDGTLYIAPSDTGPSYRSRDGALTFTPVRGGPRLTSIKRTRLGYLALPQHAPPGQYLTSADGTQWSNLPLP